MLFASESGFGDEMAIALLAIGAVFALVAFAPPKYRLMFRPRRRRQR